MARCGPIGRRARCESSKHLLAKGSSFWPLARPDGFRGGPVTSQAAELGRKVIALEEVIFARKSPREQRPNLHLKPSFFHHAGIVGPLVRLFNRLISLASGNGLRAANRKVKGHAIALLDELSGLSMLINWSNRDPTRELISESRGINDAWISVSFSGSVAAGLYHRHHTGLRYDRRTKNPTAGD